MLVGFCWQIFFRAGLLRNFFSNMNSKDVGPKGSFTRKKLFQCLLCASAFLVQFTAFGFYRGFGSIYVSMQEKFTESNALIAWTGSLSIAMTFLLTPITFRVFDLVGYRLSLLLGGTLIGLSLVATSFASSIFETYFTLGLMFAIGQSLCYFAPLLILPHYFKRKLSLAHGIVLCGSSLGGLAQAPGLGFILQKYGFSSGMRLSSVTALLIIAVSVLFKLPEESFGPNSLKCRKERKREITIKTEMEEIPLLRNYAYIIFVFAIMLVSFGVFIPFVHLVRLAMDTGISYSMAVFLPGITSIAQAVGNVGFGKLASLPNYSKISLCKWATIVIGIVTTFVPIFTSFIGLAAYSFLFGIADGSIATSTMLIIRDLITKEQFNRGYSAYLICNCIAILAGPPFAGMFNLLFALKNQA
ncbi:monocarboxylate transporter 10-like isoform X1 [Rhopilema esculentum]|uniref:monocarboxylate transporter 10-like isoform X1 n=1 Tax=Rhopilema esculentum TaxID=499914 RepID=UPI0031E10F2A